MGEQTVELAVDLVITVAGLKGSEAAGSIADGAEAGGMTVDRTTNNVDARILLDSLLAPGDVVLFKASPRASTAPASCSGTTAPRSTEPDPPPLRARV
jgi:hypothetical protein